MDLRAPDSPPPGVRQPVPAAPGSWLALRVLTLLILVVLVVLAAIVVLVLPGLVADTPVASAPRAPAAGTSVPATPAPREAQADDATRRQSAERALGQLLRARARLEADSASVWAPTEMQAATAAIAAADADFAARRFDVAERGYRLARERLEALEAQKPARFQEALAKGSAALAAGDGARARSLLDTALVIRPGDPDATVRRRRAQTIDQVMARYREGLEQESAGELDAAHATLSRAAATDPGFDPGKEALARVGTAIADRDFRAAMSRTLAALARGELDAAGEALSEARALRPSDPGVTDAARRLARAGQERRLRALQSRARGLEADEQWEQAIAIYDDALVLDAHAAFAAEGRARSERRLELHQAMERHIRAPQRLSARAPLEEAEALLTTARSLPRPGPRLQAQVQRLDALTRAAREPVAVTLRSDGLTDVTVFRVGRVGAVSERVLALRPGRYVAFGTRAGYRDVRKEFVVPAGGPGPLVVIRCEEPV